MDIGADQAAKPTSIDRGDRTVETSGNNRMIDIRFHAIQSETRTWMAMGPWEAGCAETLDAADSPHEMAALLAHRERGRLRTRREEE